MTLKLPNLELGRATGSIVEDTTYPGGDPGSLDALNKVIDKDSTIKIEK
ncbi:hypothetical protein GOV14_02205 [Candidatus Pacearchaeota archaeon]|nr:hypothetical protein [Candidatus Pacearchaeota archaeon]